MRVKKSRGRGEIVEEKRPLELPTERSPLQPELGQWERKWREATETGYVLEREMRLPEILAWAQAAEG